MVKFGIFQCFRNCRIDLGQLYFLAFVERLRLFHFIGNNFFSFVGRVGFAADLDYRIFWIDRMKLP